MQPTDTEGSLAWPAANRKEHPPLGRLYPLLAAACEISHVQAGQSPKLARATRLEIRAGGCGIIQVTPPAPHR